MYLCTLVNGGSNSGRSRPPPAPVFPLDVLGGHSRKNKDRCTLSLSAQTACRTGRMPVLAWPCCRWPCRYVHSHLQLLDSWLPCSCPDTQPSAAGDFVTCRFHFSSVHHRKLFPGSRQWIPDPSLGRWRWPLRTTRHIQAQPSTVTLCCREQKI